MGGFHEAGGQVHRVDEKVKKLILLLVFFAGASATVPSLRERVEPRVVPVWDSALRRADPIIKRAKVPIDRWAAQHEAQAIARMIRSRGGLPRPSEFPDYLRQNWRGGRQGRDPWGNWYYLVVSRDSITVGSAGPDRERNTEDDIRASVERR